MLALVVLVAAAGILSLGVAVLASWALLAMLLNHGDKEGIPPPPNENHLTDGR